MKKLLLKLSLFVIVFITMSANANDKIEILAQPENDYIADAIDVSFFQAPYLENIQFTEATNDGDSGQQGGCDLSYSAVWYKFTATKAGIVVASISQTNSPIVIFYSAPNANATDASELTYIDVPSNPCNFSPSSSIPTETGITYYIYMKNNETSDVSINVEDAFAAPVNDHITNAINIGNETPPYIDEDVHILMATNTDDGGQDGCTTASVPAIWYKFTAEQDGQFSVFITENGQQNGAVVYVADDLNATSGTELTYLDNEPVNFCGPSTGAVIDGIEGQSYYIVIISASPYVTIGFDISLTLGTTENTLEGFTYYPNPISNEINLQAQSNIDEVTIVNTLGQVVYSEKVGTSSRTINLSNLSKGLYIMNVTSEGASASYKVIKK